ncbi:Coenzyme F420 hydrogenase/dehydrogenase, beta subunit C-terminal domain [Lacrimispora xylanisolvens]|uniref:Coenzyme F420 hydrogenase/dehydrogenase, beta subunit C-terminal domain n=1 Tax=Lacrimispora xylanisolvens TaxID=384636 RepID=UPI003D9C8226
MGVRSRDNLFTLDLICHGVPSPEFLRKYFEYQEKKLGEKLEHFNFRSKEKRGWGTQYLLKTKTKTERNLLSLDKYGKHFINGDCYRECCYECRYASIDRVGDITVGGFLGGGKN